MEIVFIIPVINEVLMKALKLCLRSLAAGGDAAAATVKCYFPLSCCKPFSMSLNFKDAVREIKRSFPPHYSSVD